MLSALQDVLEANNDLIKMFKSSKIQEQNKTKMQKFLRLDTVYRQDAHKRVFANEESLIDDVAALVLV